MLLLYTTIDVVFEWGVDDDDHAVFMLFYKRACSSKWETCARKEKNKQKKGIPDITINLIKRASNLACLQIFSTHNTRASIILTKE